MAKPFIRYANTVKSVIGENNGLDFYKVYIRDNDLGFDLNLPFKSTDGFRLDYPTNDNEPQEVFFGSNCTIPFLVEDATGQSFIDDLIEDQEERFFIDIYKTDGVMPILERPFWRGVVIMDEVEHENKDFPYVVNVVAIDGLKQLNERPINQTALVNTDSTVLEKIQGILKETSTSILYGDADEFIVTSMRWFEEDMVSGIIDPLANLRYNSPEVDYTTDNDGIIVYSSCAEVLDAILKPLYCRITMINGSYHVVQVNGYKDTDLTVFRYAKNYARTTIDPNSSPAGVISSNETLAVRKVLNNNNPISTGVYSQEEGAIYRYFGAANNAFAKYKLEFNEDTATVNAAGLNATNILVIRDTSLGLQIDLDCYILYEDTGLASTQSYLIDISQDVTIAIEDSGGTKYYLEPAGTWTTTPTIHLTNYSPTNQMNFKFRDGRNGYFLDNYLVSNISASTPPVSGELFVAFATTLLTGTIIPQGGLSLPYTPITSVISREINIAFSYFDLNGGTLPKSITYNAENPSAPDSSINIDLGDVTLSDRTGSGNYWQSFLFWDGATFNEYTNGWQLEKAGSIYPVGELYVREVLSIRREPIARLDVTLLGDYNPLYSVFYDLENFAFFGGTFNSSVGSWDVTLVQVTYNNTGIVLTSSSDTGPPPTLLVQAINNANTAINSRVRWRSLFQDGNTYQPNDQVLYNTGLFLALVETATLPTVDNPDWVLLNPMTTNEENPFSLTTNGGAGGVQIKYNFSTLDPTYSMFIFDSNYNLVENPLIDEDLYFERVGSDIILKDI